MQPTMPKYKRKKGDGDKKKNIYKLVTKKRKNIFMHEI